MSATAGEEAIYENLVSQLLAENVGGLDPKGRE